MAHEGDKVNGRTWFMQFSDDAGVTWQTTVCEKGTTFDQSRDELNADSKCGSDKTPGDNETATIKTDLLFIDSADVTATETSFNQFQTWYKAKTILQWRLGPSGTLATGVSRLAGTGWLKGLSVTAPHDDLIGMSIDFVAYPDNTTVAIGI